MEFKLGLRAKLERLSAKFDELEDRMETQEKAVKDLEFQFYINRMMHPETE